jgi:hypothetical protein
MFLSIFGGVMAYCAVALILHSVWTALGFGVFVAVIAASSAVSNRKFRRMRESRQGQDIGTFAWSVPFRELDTWVVRATYEEISACMGMKKETTAEHAVATWLAKLAG